jgi:hypothetical protein
VAADRRPVSTSDSDAPFCQVGIPEIQDLNVLPQFRRRRVAASLMDAAEALIAARHDTAGIGVGLYSDYAAAHLVTCRTGRGGYRGNTVQPGASVRVDDDLVLMMTRQLL